MSLQLPVTTYKLLTALHLRALSGIFVVLFLIISLPEIDYS